MSDDTVSNNLNLSQVIDLMKDVRTEVRSMKRVVIGVNRELGGVQSTLKSIQRCNSTQDKKIDKIHVNQMSCRAKNGYPSIVAKISKLNDKVERHQEITGNILPPGTGGYPVYSPVPPNRKSIFPEKVAKMMPYLLVSFAIGAGIIAIVLYKTFFAQ
jgi:hypothetical protein